MSDGVPVPAIDQVSNKTHSKGTRFRILGLGLIESYDPAQRLFKIREVMIDTFQQRGAPEQMLGDDLDETALQPGALEARSPLV